MGEIVIGEVSTIDTPTAGNVTLAPKTDGKMYAKDDAGTEYDLTAGADALTPADFVADGDILIGTGNGTYKVLSKPTLSSGDGDNVLITEDNTNDVKWTKHQSNACDLNYVATSTYNVDYATDDIIVGVATSDMTFSFTEPNDYFSVTGRGKRFSFKNATEDYILTVKLDGTSTFQNGLNEVKLHPRDTLNMGVVRANIADGYFLLQNVIAKVQARYSTTWAAANFASLTAIPFDTNDWVGDDNVVDHSTSTNNSRITFKAKGQATITFWFGIDSTGGTSYAISGYLRKNGTTAVSGSNFGFGNYQTEDTHVCVGPIIFNHDADDYVEVMADQNNLTGNMYDMVIHVEDKL